MEAEGSKKIQDDPQLHSNFEASLGFVKCYWGQGEEEV